MDWRLLLVAAMVLATLAGGSVLVAQVESDLQDHLGGPVDATAFTPPGDVPFKLKGLKLPGDLPFGIPPGTEISPALDKLKLPEDLDLALPADMDLTGLHFDLPEDFDLRLPEGTRFDGSRLTLPEGASFRLPDGSVMDVPPGVSLDLPPDLARQLLAQGLPLGALPSGSTFSLRDLPPGLDVGVLAPPLTGGGVIRLPQGTEIRLPPGARLPPGFEAGLLGAAARLVLPPGTEFDIPLGDGTSLRGSVGRSTMPVPQPVSPPPPVPVAPPQGTPLETEIDRLPTMARKGEPFRIEGYVRERAGGAPVAGAPVEVFVNETKETPGVLVGRAKTGADGRFSLVVELPRDKPARQYQLVNHAASFTSAAGNRYADAWGDPPIYSHASTSIDITLAPRASVGAKTPIEGRLVDELGTGVPDAKVQVRVGDLLIPAVTTLPDGTFRASHVFEQVGSYVVSVRFEGAPPYYEGTDWASALLDVDERPSLEMGGASVAYRGQSAAFQVRAFSGARPLPGATIEVTSPFGSSATITDAEGRMTFTGPIPRTHPLGPGTIDYYLVSPAFRDSYVFEVRASGALSLALPATASLKGEGVPIDVKLLDDSGLPLRGVPVTVRLSGPGGVRDLTDATDSRGGLRLLLQPPAAAPGEYVVSASVSPSTFVDAAPAQATVRMGEAAAAWSVPPTAVRGKDLVVDATLTYAGLPMARAPVTLELFGTRPLVTDAQGKARWTVRVPEDAAAGAHPATLVADAATRLTQETRVVAVPRLAFETPAEYDPEEGVRANLSLTDEGRGPMPGAPLAVTLTAGNWSATRALTTDAQGRWSGVLDTTGAPRANLTVVARREASPESLEAEASRTLSVKAANVETTGTRSWLLPLAVVGLAASAGAGAWALRGRLRRPAAAPPAPAPPPPVALASDLDLRVGIPEGEPLVWGVGEPLEVTLRSRGEVRPGSLVLLQGPDGELALHLDAEGQAGASLRPEREGVLRVVARRPDAPRDAPAELRVEVVDYRKAVAREFDALVDAARAAGLPVTRQSTPREVEAALVSRLGEDAASLLDEVALLMEVTNYSQAPVSRKEFLRFLAASGRLQGTLKGA